MMMAPRHKMFEEPTNIECIVALPARKLWLVCVLIAVVFGFLVVRTLVIS